MLYRASARSSSQLVIRGAVRRLGARFAPLMPAAAVPVAWHARASASALFSAPMAPPSAEYACLHAPIAADACESATEREAEGAGTESWWSKLLGFAADFLRAVELAILFSPAAITFPLVWFAGGSLWRWWIALSLRLVQRAGPTFIKLGQWASTRPDVFPVDMCHTFSALHDDVAAMPFTEVLRVLEDELGSAPGHVFAALDSEPVGQGCIAQVHKGRLRCACGRVVGGSRHLTPPPPPPPPPADPAQVVAVKVQRPGVRRAFERDVRLMTSTAQLLTWVIPSLRWLCLSDCVARFEEFMYSQLDFSVEAAHLARFRSNFSEDNTVVFPTPIRWSRRVLVESFEPGPSISEFLGHQSAVRKRYA